MISFFKKIYINRKKIPIVFFLFLHKFFKPRDNKLLRFLNFEVFILDFISFYYEILYIFKDEIYNFEVNNNSPLIIDGGSCIGTSILYFKKIYPNSRIIAFEPSPKVFEILKRNIDINSFQNIQLINCGLYNANSKLFFSKNEVDSGRIEVDGEMEIDVVKLSDYIKEDVDFLKLNIEGSEFLVLKELEDSGKIKNIKRMCFEWHSFANQEQDLDKILSILKNNNFKYYISSLSTAKFGKFKAEKGTEYFLMIYAKQIN